MKYWTDCTKAQQIERWENVERVLKSLSPHERRKHWDMRNWGVKTECGTVACAAGHCGMDPWFRRRGFQLLPYRNTPEEEQIDEAGLGGFANEVDPMDFFGYVGCDQIFFRGTPRPVATVIREVRAYIKELKATP